MHCGACVGTCPVNCMFLYEMKIEGRCIICVLCGKVCPVGAITLRSEKMKEIEYDVRGSAGSVSARYAAERSFLSAVK